MFNEALMKIFVYRWHDIINVVNHKRTFNIQCTISDQSVGFTLADADTGRYFWKLCVLQHTFYTNYEKNHKHTPETSGGNNSAACSTMAGNLNLMQDDTYDSKDNLYASDSHISSSTGAWNTDSVVSSSVSLAAHSQHQLRNAASQNWTPAPGDYSNQTSNWALVGSNVSLNNRAQSTSCLDLSNNNMLSQDRERLKAFLPGYRSAPDYETAVQQKYRTSESELRLNTPVIQIQSSPIINDSNINMYTGSQPDVHRATAVADALFGQPLQHQYPDVTQTTNPVYQPQLIGGLDGFAQQFQMNRFNKPPPPYPANRLSSTSTPDLALASHRALYGYRGAYVSGSSPDLVSTRTFLNPQQFLQHQQLQQQQQQQQQHHHQQQQQQIHIPLQTLHHQIPQLPSNTFRYRYSQSHIPHGTYENLNFLEPQTKTNLLSQKLQKAYEGVYLMSSQQQLHQQQQQQQQQHQPNNGMISSQQIVHNGSIEPIYENVPLPWPPTDVNEMRDRTSSIQSAPGVIRFNKQPPQQPVQQQQPYISQPHLALADAHNLNLSSLNIHDSSQTNKPDKPVAAHRTIVKTASNSNTMQPPLLPPQSAMQPPTQHQPLTSASATTITATPTTITPQPILQENKSDTSHHSIAISHQSLFQPSASSSTSDTNHKSHPTNTLKTDTMNRSQSTNQLDSSQSSAYTNASTTDSGVSFGNKEKKKKRWGFFGGSKGSLNSSDKQKSATLGRDKEKSNSSKNAMSREEENNLRHRWSTGLPRLPLPVTISKEKLVRIIFITFFAIIY